MSFSRAWLLSLSALVAACGGGGGDPPRGNAAPRALAGPDQVQNEGAVVTLDGSDSFDPNGTVQGYLWEQTGGPEVSLTGADSATPRFTAPATTATVALGFRLTVTDNAGATGTDEVSVTVNPVNLAPVATDDSATTDEDTAVSVDVLANDTDPDDAASNSDPAELNPGSITVTDPVGGTARVASGRVLFSPAVNFNGTASFRYTVADRHGAVSGPATVTIAVIPVNDAPTISAIGDLTIAEDGIAGPVAFTVADIDTPVEQLSLTAGSDTQALVPDSAITLGGTTSERSISATPVANGNGTAVITVRVTDADGAFATERFTLTVTAVNDAPVASGASATGDEDRGAITGTLSASDIDSATLSYRAASAPANGSVTIATGGDFEYTPALNFAGTDSFTFVASDGALDSEPATVTLTVNELGEAVLSVADATLGESGGTLDFVVSLSRAPDGPVGVDFASADGSARAGQDYAATAGSLAFTPDGPRSQVVRVPVTNDSFDENDEALSLALTLGAGADSAEPGDLQAAGLIQDDDTSDLLSIGAARRSVKPSQAHIDGVLETRLGGTERTQKFNLGGFGINPTQSLPNPADQAGEQLTQPAELAAFSGSRGEEPIQLRVMLMQQADGERLAFVTLDAIGAGNIIQDGVKAAVSGATGIAPENILFGQTHSHAGPDLQGLWGGVPEDWIQNTLYVAAAEAAAEALASSRPARLTLAQGQSVQFNNYRRPRINPEADADGTLTLLEAVGDDGTPVGSILQYNAHPTSIDENPRAVHADYIQGAMDWIEDKNGGVGLYYNGPIADASGSGGRAGCTPAAQDADYGNVRCRGEGIADQALQYSKRELAPTLAVDEREVILPITNPGFLAFGALGSFNRYYNFVQQVPVETIPGIGPEARNLPQATPTATTLVSRVTIGGAAAGLEIVTIPGETTNTFGQYIRGLAQTNVMLLGLTHNSFGYILPEEEFSYVDQTGDAGLVAPFTGYEENVSLGPLTAPLLRSQGYNRLFGVDPTTGDARDLPPSLTACLDDMDSQTCLLQVIENRIELFIEQWIVGGAATLAEFCHDNAGDFEAICVIPDTLAGLVGSLPAPGAGGDADLLAAAADAQVRGCDLLDTSNCLYPFPNDWFTAEAAPGTIQHADQGGTGRRVNLNPLATPRNSAGKPVDPTEWNRSDGFSPGALISTYVPQLSLEATFARPSHEIGLANLALSQDPEAPILVLEVQDDGSEPVRHLVWSEIDQNANLLTISGAPNVGTFPIGGVTNEHGHISRPQNDGRAALLIRPGKNFAEGKRYVVVLRKLKNADGETLAPQAGFRACLSGDSALPPVQARCEQLEDRVFPVLEDAGIAIDDSLYLAWDFTVESTGSAIGRLRHMRDTAFASLSSDPSEDDCTQLTPANAADCAAPKVEITTVIENPQGGIARRIEGMLTVPNYLAPIGPSPLDNPQVAQAIVQMCANAPEGEFASGCSDLRDGADLAQGAALPSRLFYSPADGTPAPDPSNPFDPTGLRYGDGLPDANGTLTTRFLCQIPAQATPDNPARASLYGHGQLDRGVAITYEGTPDVAREHNYMFCAVDWFGFRTGDAANVASALIDLSNFPVIPDASQQGMLNFMFLARAMGHPQGLGALPEFQGADGRPLFDAREIFYNGNSQGGIFGGVVLAASKDVNRGVLGSLGMNYSTLLTRSKNFDEYAGVLYSSYTDPLDRQLLFSMMQMLWDRSENNGYAHHIVDNSAFDGPANVVKLDPMFGDPQVTMFSAEVMARTLGVPFDNGQTLQVETLGAQYLGANGRRHPGVVAYEGLEPLQFGTEQVKGSALVVWDTNHAGAYSDIPPITNTPPRTGVDNHDASQKAKYGRCHMAHFLRTDGELIDIRPVQFDGAPCPAVPPAAPTVLPGTSAAPSDVFGQILSALNTLITPVQQAIADAFSDGAQQAGEVAGIALPTPGQDPAPELREPEALRAGVAKRAIQVPVGTPLGGYLRPPVGGEYIGADPVGELTDNIPAMADGCDPAQPDSCPPLAPLPDELRKVTSPFATYSPPSRGYYDSLIAKAVALHDGHDYVVLVKTDFIGMLDELVQDVKAEVKARKGIELGDGLIMSATHSHDGPGAVANNSTRYFWLAMDVYQPEVYRRVVGQLADVVVAALEDLRPARIGHGSGLEREGLNGYRRGRLASYADDDAPDGDGLTDADALRSRIGVLRVDDAATGETRALVINWAAHGIAFDVENQYFSGDVLGAVERETEQLMGIDVAMLVQSVGGDVSPRGVSNDNKLQRIESYGKRLAPQVKAVAEDIRKFQDAPDLRAVSQRIVLNRERLGYAGNEYPYPWGAGQCGNDIAVPFADVGVRDIPGYEDSGLPVKQPYCLPSPPPDANDLADNGVAENGAFYPQDTILTAASIGDITIMVQPGEPLVEYGVRLMEMAGREGFDADDTFVWGYAGDHIGYILPPVEEDWATFGGAESTTTFWGWKQGARFIDVTQGLLAALRDGTAAPADEFQVDYTKYRQVYDAVPAPVPAPSILPGTAVAQPSNIKRFERTAFVFEGGDPVVDFPSVRMLHADGTPVRRANGEAIDTFFEMHLKYRLVSGRHLWTVEFEAPKDWATGSYKFAVAGTASQGMAVPYALESASFAVAPATNLQLDEASCTGGVCSVRAAYTPVPSNYRVVDARVPADQAAPMRTGTVSFNNGTDTVSVAADGSGVFRASIGGTVTVVATDSFGNTAPALTLGAANPDRDGDGVPNETDACPDQSGPASNNGCPEQAAGFPLCEPFAGYCLSDIPGIGEPLQAAIDTAYNALTGGGTEPPAEVAALINDPVDPLLFDCTGPAGDPEPGTPEFAFRDAENIFCTQQRHQDTLPHPANNPYMVENYGADPYRAPARHAGTRFRHAELVIPGVDGQAGTSFDRGQVNNAEIYRPCAAGTCENMPAGLQTFEPPYPIAIVMHGAASDKKHLEWATQPLAERGYFVLTANGTGAGLPGILLDWLFDPANPYAAELDLSRIGTTGHSLGAENATRVQGDARVSGIVAWDPCDGSGGNECRDSRGSRLHDKGSAAQTPTLFLTADYLGFPGYPEPQTEVPGDLRVDGFEILRDNGVDTMLVTPRATTHLDWAGSFTFGNRLNEATSLHYTLSWFDRYVKGKLVVANGKVVTTHGRTEAEERAYRQAVVDEAYTRLTAAKFDEVVDLHNISQGFYDEQKAVQSGDPEYGGNVPYRVEGLPLADRLSFYHRSVCSITRPDLLGGSGAATLERADTTADGDMRRTGCAGNAPPPDDGGSDPLAALKDALSPLDEQVDALAGQCRANAGPLSAACVLADAASNLIDNDRLPPPGGFENASCATGTRLAGGRSYQVVLDSASGERISFQVLEPSSFNCVAGHPLIVHSHGFGGSRSTSGFADYRNAGYAVISIDQRGFGASTGTVRVMDPDFEGRDLVQILDWVEANLDYLKYRDNNLLAGAIGGSYGGGFQFLLHNVDAKNRLDALAPDITWHDLRYSLNPGDTLKSAFGLLLTAGGEAGSYQPGLANADDPAHRGIDPYIKEVLARALATGEFPREALEWFRYHSPGYWCGLNDQPVMPYGARANSPVDPNTMAGTLLGEAGGSNASTGQPPVDVLISQGLRDNLFNFNDAWWNYQCARVRGGDVRLITHQSGHILNPAGLIPGAPSGTPLDVQAAGGSDNCGSLLRYSSTVQWFDEKLRTGANAARLDPTDGNTVCLSLADGDAVFVPEYNVLAPRAARFTEVLEQAPQVAFYTLHGVRASSVPHGAAAQAQFAATQADTPVVTPLLTVTSDTGLIVGGIPVADLVVTTPAGANDAVCGAGLDAPTARTGCDSALFVGLGVLKAGSSDWVLIDDQVTPVRGLGAHAEVSFAGIGERLAPGDQLGLMVYGYHRQYLGSYSRDATIPAVNVSADLRLPLYAVTEDGTPDFGTPAADSVLPAGGDGGEPEVSGYGPGLIGAIGQFFAELNDAVVAAVSGDAAGAQAALAAAAGNLADNAQDLASADGADPVTAIVGDDPAEYLLRETTANRRIEPVVLTGDKLASWSVPAAQGAPYPYPSGAGITNQGSGAENLEPLNAVRDPLMLGEVRSAHNGVMLYPQAGAPMGPDVTRLAAYRFEPGHADADAAGFVEIPVQVDQRYPYFLANAKSTFGVYSGTDEELSYDWDVEKWGNPGVDEGTQGLADSCEADFSAYRRGGALHTPDPVSGLDFDDEVVFMYQDAGPLAAAEGVQPADPAFDAAQGLQQVALADPLAPGAIRYAYLGLKKAGLKSAFADTAHYVRYSRAANADQWIDQSFFRDDDPEKIGTSNDNYGPNRPGTVCGNAANPSGAGASPRRSTVGGVNSGDGDRVPRDGLTVATDTYQWHASGRWMVREVRVTKPGAAGAYGPDLIDRWKGRAFQQSPDSTVSLVGFEDEQVNWEVNSTLLGERCGPVRCIREVWGADSGTNVTKTETFYRDAVAARYRVRVHPIPPDGLYTSWDYNRSAMVPTAAEKAAGVPGGRYFSSLRPNGVPVDGVNDDVGQIDRVSPDPVFGMCLTSDGPRPASEYGGVCPLFFDAADPTFNLPLAFDNWEQVSGKGNFGSLVYVFELKGATSLTNPLVVPYYRDDACLDDGTGDDPVRRPYPGESSTDPRVVSRYTDLDGSGAVECHERQGAHGAHGVHYFFTHDSDNAFVMGKPLTEADATWWQIMVPTDKPRNVGAAHANVVRAPVQAVVTPRLPASSGGVAGGGFRVGTGQAGHDPVGRTCIGGGSTNCGRAADPSVDADAIRDPLIARASAITGANGQTFILVTTTNIGYFLAYKAEQSGLNGIYDVRLRIANATGVPSTNITVVSDHSHNGPDTIGIWGGVSAEYMKITADAVVKAALQAYGARRPARIRVAAVNQNEARLPGVPALDSSYDLPPGNDPVRGNPYNEFRLLVADDADSGERILTFVNYAPHATVTNGDRFDGKYRLTGDWTAWAPMEAENLYGGMGLAAVGALGGTDWNKNGDAAQKEAEARARLRGLMAAATARLQPVAGGDVAVDSTFIREQMTQPALLLNYKPGIDYNRPQVPSDGFDVRIDRSVLPPFLTGTVVGTYVSAVRIGDVFLSTFPGEPFGELDHAIQNEGRVLGAREHFLLGGANDFFGYMVKKPETYEQTLRTGALYLAGCPDEDVATQLGVRPEGEGACADHWTLMVSPTIGSHIVCTLQNSADRLGFGTANRDAECPALTALDNLAAPPESGSPAAQASLQARASAVQQAQELADECRGSAAPAGLCDALAEGARTAAVYAGVPVTTREGDGRSYAGVAVKDASWHLGASAGQFAASGAGIANDRGYDPYGHSTRKVGSDILGTRITTRALVVQGANGQRIAIASNDLYLPNDLLHRRTAQLLAEHDLAALANGGVVTGITGQNLATSSSHSHTSPFYSTPAWGTWIFQDVFDLRFYEYMARQMADAVIEAASTLKPVRMGGATVHANDIQAHTYGPVVAHDGTPAGQPRDYTTQAVTVVSFDDISGGTPRPLANWVIFGVHPEWVWGEEIVNGDITHAVMRMLDRETGAVTLWSQRETGSSGPHKDERVHLAPQRREFQESNFAGYDRAARLLTDSIKRALGQLASGMPERPDQFAAYQTGFDVASASQRVAPPVTRPYPGTSNCNSDRVFEGDPGTVVVPGLPDCSYDAEEQLDPVTEPFWDALPANPADLARQLNEAGVPIPTSYSGTSFTAVQETAAVHLQVFKLGTIAATMAPNEQFTSQALNIESRLDKVPDNLWHGFDFACVAQARGLLPVDSDPKIAGHCARQNARYPEERLELPGGLAALQDEDFPRARAQIHNDASGWELDPVYAANSGDTSGVSTLGGEAEPEDITQIKGNFTHEEFTDHGYDLVVSVGMANDYWGYMAEYREYRSHSNGYRKALNALGPHGADFVATRLSRMAANLNGAGVALPYNPLDAAYQAEGARAEGLARTLGELARAYTAAYDATLPPDGGVPGIVTQPEATVKRFSAATLKFVGGSNYTDMPRVRVERRVNGEWQTYGTQEGEVQLQLKFLPSAFSLDQQLPIDEGVGATLPDPQALALWRAGQFEWVWTASFEAFVSELDNLGARPGITPAGTYRFVVDGQHRGLMSFPNAAAYQLVSQPFEVTPWDGITVEDLEVGTDGRVSFNVGPVNTFTQFRRGPEADDPIETLSPGYTVGPVDYPDSYAGGISWIRNERQLLAGDQQYCGRCTFRPWADSAQLAVDTIPVTVTRANGSTTTLNATYSGGRWTTATAIGVGASAQVPAGVIVDQYGEKNGAASAVVTRAAPPSDSDGDGIPDGADACPAEPGPADNDGCPLPPADTDGDGVTDDVDACDTEPGPAANNGCPEEEPAADPLTQLIENVSTALANFIDNATATLMALADSISTQVEALVASPETAPEQAVAAAQDTVDQTGIVNADNPWTRRRPLNISHRGGENDWPENTMFAYAESIRAAGSDMIEMDLYETADGELVVIHDDTVDRTTDGSGAVSSFTLAQIRALDAAYWFAQDGATRYGTSSGRPESQYIYRGIATGARAVPAELAALGYAPADFRIPTLREIFENPRFAGVLINIELKPDPDSTGQYEAKLAAMIREYGREDDVIVASFLDHNLALFKANAPEIATSVPTGQAAVDKGAGTGPGLGATLAHKAFQVPMDFNGVQVLSAEYIADAHARGMAVHAWTINDREDMVQLLNWCVDGIMSDRPLLLEEVLQSDEWSCPLDPAPAANLQHFIGSLHEHSGFSDGTIGTTPADYFAAGRARGLDFMAGSEHSDNAMAPVTASTDCLSDAFPDCLQASPDGVQKWSVTAAIADAADVPGVYSAIRGFEWTSDRYGHINVFFSQNDLNAKTSTGYAVAMEDFWQWLALPPSHLGGADGLVVFNHPGREDQVHSGCVDGEVPEEVPVLGGQQVSDCLAHYGWPGDPAYAWNGMAYRPEHDGRVVGIEMYGKGRDYYDGDNGAPAGGWYAFALDQGWHVAPVGAEDEHGTSWGAPTFAKTVMLAKENTRAALRGAMAARRFYALAEGHGDIRIDFTAGGSVMGSRLSRATGTPLGFEVQVTDLDAANGVAAARIEVVGPGGAVLDSATGRSHRFEATVANDEQWRFVRVLDASGTVLAVSAPIWFAGR